MTTKFIEAEGQSSAAQKTRALALGLMAAMSLLMFGLAYTAHAATLTRQLDIGATGTDVSTLQAFLATNPSIYPQGLVTGYYGNLTAAAVSNYQVQNGLPAAGRVGPLTLALLNTQMASGAIGSSGASPVIGAVSVNTGSNTATINWNTTGNTTGIVYYGTSPLPMQESSATSGVVIGGSSVLVNSALQVNHNVTLTGLQPNTIYYYTVYVRDALGNENISWPTTFTTTS